jgi:hypothetical protein
MFKVRMPGIYKSAGLQRCDFVNVPRGAVKVVLFGVGCLTN